MSRPPRAGACVCHSSICWGSPVTCHSHLLAVSLNYPGPEARGTATKAEDQVWWKEFKESCQSLCVPSANSGDQPLCAPTPQPCLLPLGRVQPGLCGVQGMGGW